MTLSSEEGWETGPGYSTEARACLGKFRKGAVEVDTRGGSRSECGDEEGPAIASGLSRSSSEALAMIE